MFGFQYFYCSDNLLFQSACVSKVPLHLFTTSQTKNSWGRTLELRFGSYDDADNTNIILIQYQYYVTSLSLLSGHNLLWEDETEFTDNRLWVILENTAGSPMMLKCNECLFNQMSGPWCVWPGSVSRLDFILRVHVRQRLLWVVTDKHQIDQNSWFSCISTGMSVGSRCPARYWHRPGFTYVPEPTADCKLFVP